LRAIQDYDRLGSEQFFSEHGFAPATTYVLVRGKRRNPPKAILGAAYEFATGRQLGSGDRDIQFDRLKTAFQKPKLTIIGDCRRSAGRSATAATRPKGDSGLGRRSVRPAAPTQSRLSRIGSVRFGTFRSQNRT
jgi:hypothetical protein